MVSGKGTKHREGELQDGQRVSFQDFEQVAFREALALAVAALEQILQRLDELLMQQRDADRYKVKGMRRKRLDTLRFLDKMLV